MSAGPVHPGASAVEVGEAEDIPDVGMAQPEGLRGGPMAMRIARRKPRERPSIPGSGEVGREDGHAARRAIRAAMAPGPGT